MQKPTMYDQAVEEVTRLRIQRNALRDRNVALLAALEGLNIVVGYVPASSLDDTTAKSIIYWQAEARAAIAGAREQYGAEIRPAADRFETEGAAAKGEKEGRFAAQQRVTEKRAARVAKMGEERR